MLPCYICVPVLIWEVSKIWFFKLTFSSLKVSISFCKVSNDKPKYSRLLVAKPKCDWSEPVGGISKNNESYSWKNWLTVLSNVVIVATLVFVLANCEKLVSTTLLKPF